MGVTFRPAKWSAAADRGHLEERRGQDVLRAADRHGHAGGARFAAVDTETRRMSHYADLFAFDVVDLEPPFRPGRFLECAIAAQRAGYPCLVIDSMTHEWVGPGGVLEWHDEEVDRMEKRGSSRDAANFPAWRVPKTAHQDMLTGCRWR